MKSRIRFTTPRVVMLFVLLSSAPSWAARATLSPEEKAEGFELLFNGENLEGWSVQGLEGEAPSIRDGTMRMDGLDWWAVITKRRFKDFVLRCEVMIEPKGNTGILFHTPPKITADKGVFVTSPEIQLCDDAGSELSEESSGAIFLNRKPIKNAIKPAGEWNNVEVTVRDNHVKVVLNGELVQDVDLNGVSLKNVTRTKKDVTFEALEEGGIAFQHKSFKHKAALRNIRVKELGAEEPRKVEEKMKIILDTDIGDDIDDAWAVALLISHPRFQPLGVTVAYGNTPARSKIACKLLHKTKQTHIPVAVGRKTGEHESPQFSWAEDFNRYKPIDTPAARFLVDMVKKYPKEVTVVAVGPLPNVADALRMGSDFEENVKEVILMSGCVYGRAGRPDEPIPEWNVRADVESAKVVYGSQVKLTIVPLDSTTHVRLSDEERDRVRQHRSPLTWSLECLLRLWTSGPDSRMTLHDQLAIADAAAPGEFFGKKVELPIYVDDEGFTRVDKEKGRPITVCLEPERDAFMEFYISHLTSQRLGMTD